MKEFYERLRKHKKETNKEFIEDFNVTLMSYGIENEKQLKELTIRTLKTKDGVCLTKEERMECIHDRIEYCISRVINESILIVKMKMEHLETDYKSSKDVNDDLSVCILKNENYHVDKLIAREYDEDGNSISNNKIIELKKKEEIVKVKEKTTSKIDISDKIIRKIENILEEKNKSEDFINKLNIFNRIF